MLRKITSLYTSLVAIANILEYFLSNLFTDLHLIFIYPLFFIAIMVIFNMHNHIHFFTY